MGNAPSAPSPQEGGYVSKHRTVEERQRQRMESNNRRPGVNVASKKSNGIVVSAGRTEEKKEVEKKEVVKAPDPEVKAPNPAKTAKKNEKDIFVCNWIDRMEHAKLFDPQELAVDGAD